MFFRYITERFLALKKSKATSESMKMINDECMRYAKPKVNEEYFQNGMPFLYTWKMHRPEYKIRG